MGAPCPGILIIAFTILSASPLAAQVKPEITEPHLLSVFPSGGKPGGTVRAEVRGNLIAGAYAVWFDAGGASGQVQTVEESKAEPPETPTTADKKKKPLAVYRVAIEVEIPAAARAGTYSLRLVTPRGISSGIPFRVVDGPVVAETDADHPSAKAAQPLTPPAIVFGRLAKPGELDYYSFSATRGQELYFEVAGGEGFNPRIALFRRGGSWFDADRATRILMEEERSSDLMKDEARGTCRVQQDGDYFLEVSSLFGKGSPDNSYPLRIAARQPSDLVARASGTAPAGWSERSFTRKLEEGWMTTLAARAVEAGGAPATGTNVVATTQATGADSPAVREPGETPKLPSRPSHAPEQEPNDLAGQAAAITVPAIIEGATGRPGDVDSYRFKVEPGQRIAIEIETPNAKPPYYNPRLGVVDSQNHELFSNVDRRLSVYNKKADPHVFLKAISPRSTYTFERGGEYLLQVRDITSRYGSTDYRYRILVRPEIPHIGEVTVEGGEQDNLNRGEPKRLTITAGYEEGFTGDLSFAFEGLPPGVEAYPAVQYSDGRAPLEIPQNPDVVSAKAQKTTIVLLASPEAALTREPLLARLHCRPIAQGRLGPSLLVREIPVMVVEKPPQTAEDQK